MNWRRFLVLALACLMLGGCGAPPTTTRPPASTDPAPETTAPTAAPTVPTTVPPTTVPPTTAPPVTEPELMLETGRTIVVDGDWLASKSVVYEGVTYAKVGQFLDALDDAAFTGDDAQGYCLSWQGTDYEFLPNNPGILRNGRTTVLSAPMLTWQDSLWLPVEELCQMMNISLLDDPDRNSLFCTAIAGDWNWQTGVEIPILMYHGVSDNLWGASELFVSPANMEAQIAYLVENGYDPITFEDWSHLEDFDKPVMLTFDDGYLDNYEELFPILQKYNVKATIFLITVSVDRDERTVNTEQVQEMVASGLVSFQSHTYNHPHLSESSGTDLENQMRWSKYAITRMTGYEPIALCYPYGDSDAEARDVTMSHYKFGIAMTGGLYTTGTDESQITRYYVSRDTTLSQFIQMVSSAGQ